jgi:hypothetical protein
VTVRVWQRFEDHLPGDHLHLVVELKTLTFCSLAGSAI